MTSWPSPWPCSLYAGPGGWLRLSLFLFRASLAVSISGGREAGHMCGGDGVTGSTALTPHHTTPHHTTGYCWDTTAVEPLHSTLLHFTSLHSSLPPTLQPTQRHTQSKRSMYINCKSCRTGEMVLQTINSWARLVSGQISNKYARLDII